MGKKVSAEQLEERARRFFGKVVTVLCERNKIRGDSYLEMDLDDFATMFRDKGGRIRTAARQDLNTHGVRAELIDACFDECGYAVLMSIWLAEKLGISDEEFNTVVDRGTKCESPSTTSD